MRARDRPCRSVAEQIGEHLAGNGGHADPDALYTYWAGANDVFNYLQWAGPQLVSQARHRCRPAADHRRAGTAVHRRLGADRVGEIAALQAAGQSTSW
jgi:hypothetical protein